MKKIGILTLPLHKNYGGLLQAYALQHYLIGEGYDVFFIDRQWNESFIKKTLKKILFIKKNNNYKKITKNTSYFTEKYINPKTTLVDSEDKIEKIVSDYKLDAVIVGSDQVWRLEYTRKFYLNYFFNFISSNKSVKKISYAASFGEDSWSHSKEVTDRVAKLLSKFDSISVREDSGVVLCNEIFNVKAKQHIDPTALLSIQDYNSLIESESDKDIDGDILIYMLDLGSDRRQLIDEVVKHIGGRIFSVNVKSDNVDDSIIDRTYPTVTSWLKGFRDAKFVITDSFHGTIFSILYNKPFISYANVNRGTTRFTSVLKLFNLESRLIQKKDDFSVELLNQEINWEQVNSKLDFLRDEAKEYLKQSIK